MGDIFNMDNKFFQGLGKLVDCVCLSFLWLILCIPVVTAGAATTALYYTVNKVIRYNRGYLFREFMSAFKSNFKQSTLVWLILLLVYAIMGVDCYIMYRFAQAGAKYGVLYIVFIVFMCFATMWATYLFPYMARFENTLKHVLKNAAFIALANLGKTLLMFLLLVLAVVAVYLLPPLVFFMPVIYMLLINLIMEKIFKKYMKPEDIAAEEERNREYLN